MTDPIHHEIRADRSSDGRIVRLRYTSDHPANVMTLDSLRDLIGHVDEIAEERPRVLVLLGREGVFSGGADLSSIRAMDDETYKAYIDTEYRLFRRIEALPFVTIAVLDGPCIGNAAELALACDLRLASARTRIGFPEPKVGFVAPAQRLTRFVGIGRAKELLYTGAVLDAGAAQEAGLLTTVVDDADLGAEADKMAGEYASYAPVAIRLTKAGVARAYDRAGGGGDEDDEEEKRAAFETFKTADFREGSSAVLERRAPQFTGS